jgi:uncharacterized protein YbaP (TraB family)
MPGILHRVVAAAALALLLIGTASVRADGIPQILWRVEGAGNTVYLLGSVHLLHTSDSALPEAAMTAYADAEKIVEEIDLAAAAAEMMAPSTSSPQFLPEGQTLAAALGPELNAELQTAARTLGLDTDFMSRYQPWFVATTIEQLRMQREGYNAMQGVDIQIAMLALRDGKTVQGLETLHEQLSLFGNLPMEEQREMLRSTLRETGTKEKVADITQSWRRGDLARLETLLREGAEESPALFKTLTTDRNLRWLPQIEVMLKDKENDYLVVAGALHMVGENGLVELLKKKGYRIERL